MHVDLVRARPEDAGPVADLYLRARRAAVGIPPSAHDDDDVRRWIAATIASDAAVWLAIGGDAPPIGMLVLDGGWLEQLYVEPAQTGRGAGSMLLALAKRECPEGLLLWTFAANAGARRFYERRGFVEVRRTDGDNEEGAPDILYRWDGRHG